MSDARRLEIPIKGMDCAECVKHVQTSLLSVPGVQGADVYLTSEKAVLELESQTVDLSAIRRVVAEAGYSVPDEPSEPIIARQQEQITRYSTILITAVFAFILFSVVVGEWFGLFAVLTARVPWLVGFAVVAVGGYPIFRKVFLAVRHRQITSHTLMSLGVLAALIAGEWMTAVLVVVFMRLGDYIESFTAESARQSVRDLTAMAPQTARVLRDGLELELPVNQVHVGELVVIRPGEKIPVDGVVASGQATLDQSTVTGESMPVEAGPGSRVYAATIAQLGSLQVETTRVGADSTFGRVIRMVEEAEANRADVQRFADRFTLYYLPVVVGIAGLTLIIRGDPMATVAVLVVACSCSIALATPIAMMASIGAAAKRGLLIKGGKYLEILDQVDVLLIDKTGTVTLGRPKVTDVMPLADIDEAGLLELAASAERYSEHPLAEAVRACAQQRNLLPPEPTGFEAIPGLGVRATVDGRELLVGNQQLLETGTLTSAQELEAEGKTLLYVGEKGRLSGILAVSDELRSEMPAALARMRQLGIKRIELLSGDRETAVAAMAGRLGLAYRAELLPEDKLAVVKSYQEQGSKVVMVGDGVNDAPALAQADVGVAMGAAGTDIALEAAHVALMRDDWTLVPELFFVAQRTMRVVKMNLGFTALYNVLGLTLAALGLLPPVLAAAAQSLPDLGILANSSRLLRR